MPSIATSKISGARAVELLTVTATPDEVEVLPAASRAVAVTVWAPLVAAVVFQETLEGEVVSSAERLRPSSLNWTPATETLSDAEAVMLIVPETVVPLLGAVIETVGAVVSLGGGSLPPTPADLPSA